MEDKTLKPQIEALYLIFLGTTIVGLSGIIISIVFQELIFMIPSTAILFSPILIYILYNSTVYNITDEKVTMNRNLGGETHKEVQFDKIQNTKITEPFIYKLVGRYGNLYISTAGSNLAAIKLSSIENPKETNREIVDRFNDGVNIDDNSESSSDLSYIEYQKLREASEKLRDKIIGGDYE